MFPADSGMGSGRTRSPASTRRARWRACSSRATGSHRSTAAAKASISPDASPVRRAPKSRVRLLQLYIPTPSTRHHSRTAGVSGWPNRNANDTGTCPGRHALLARYLRLRESRGILGLTIEHIFYHPSARSPYHSPPSGSKDARPCPPPLPRSRPPCHSDRAISQRRPGTPAPRPISARRSCAVLASPTHPKPFSMTRKRKETEIAARRMCDPRSPQHLENSPLAQRNSLHPLPTPETLLASNADPACSQPYFRPLRRSALPRFRLRETPRYVPPSLHLQRSHPAPIRIVTLA